MEQSTIIGWLAGARLHVFRPECTDVAAALRLLPEPDIMRPLGGAGLPRAANITARIDLYRRPAPGSHGRRRSGRAGGVDCSNGLPALRGELVTLRELRPSDAPSLLGQLSNDEVLEYVPGAPRSLAGFQRFVAWARTQSRAGQHLTFGVVPHGRRAAVGFLQIWPVEGGFSTAEWGFVIGRCFWGTGVFDDAARLLIDLAFGRLGVARLEARVVDGDRRGNAALRRLGAVHEGRLRCGFRSNGAVRDYMMWSILARDWAAREPPLREGRGRPALRTARASIST
jgi:RimJ/RimL family protein N-acetyltransferase